MGIIIVPSTLFVLLAVLLMAEVAVTTSTTAAAAAANNKNNKNDNNVVLPPTPPNYWACQNDLSRGFPYCNTSLSISDRITNLWNLLTLKEKIAAISGQADLGNLCMCHTSNISRIGLPHYSWLVETNTMVASSCLTIGKKAICGTQFPGPLNMAASFNRTSWRLKGSVLGTEQRAFMNLHGTRHNINSNHPEWIGFTAFGPNINQQRDPRFGRSSELPGEDAFLTGHYAGHMISGLQERDAAGYPKLMAYLKHFTAYSQETNREQNNCQISPFDLWDSYLPQFEMAFRLGLPAGVMCSYNAINGVPSCANSYLLQHVLRGDTWGRHPMAHVTSDCRAVGNLARYFGAPDNATAAAWALMNGTDLEMGTDCFANHLEDAILHRGLVTLQALEESFRRTFHVHFVAGRFDPPQSSTWYSLNQNDIHSNYHQQVQLEAALQGIVLLKHENHILPLKPRQIKIAVLGPLAHTRAGLMDDYWGDQICPDNNHNNNNNQEPNFDCVPTLAESIRTINNGGGNENENYWTTNASGIDIDSQDASGMPLALDVGRNSDLIILCLGITMDQERETVDRVDTALPGLQKYFAKQVFQLKKPVIVVLVNGGQVAMDETDKNENDDAPTTSLIFDDASVIIEAFNPNSIGGTALALLLFGKENKWGKLPYTIYPYRAMQAMDLNSYDISTPPGRTYRYFTGQPIYPFGYGLSLSEFHIECQLQIINSTTTTFTSSTTNNNNNVDDDDDEYILLLQCDVTNTNHRAGDEVIQVYRIPGQDIYDQVAGRHPIPHTQLVEFERVSVPCGGTAAVTLYLNATSTFALVIEHGNNTKTMYSGTYQISVTNNGNRNMPPHLQFPVHVVVHPKGEATAAAGGGVKVQMKVAAAAFADSNQQQQQSKQS